MGLGEPIGYSARLTMNNNGLYQNQVNTQARGVHIALMGDPTLRMYQVAPPASVSVSGNIVTWVPSTDTVAGYHVYRATSPDGPFTRVTSSLTTGTSFTDAQRAGWSNDLYGSGREIGNHAERHVLQPEPRRICDRGNKRRGCTQAEHFEGTRRLAAQLDKPGRKDIPRASEGCPSLHLERPEQFDYRDRHNHNVEGHERWREWLQSLSHLRALSLLRECLAEHASDKLGDAGFLRSFAARDI